MIRLVFLFILVCWTTSDVSSQPLSEQEARSHVMDFLSDRGVTLSKSRTSKSSESIVLSYSSPRLYAYNVQGRFVLASGDRSMPPILGYSDGCSFEKAMESECFRALLRHISADYNPNFRIYKPADVADYVEPLCKDTWHQYAPYNNLTPMIDDEHSVVGCVATSMSELMHYYRYPVRGTGSFSYNDSTGCGQILSSDFSSHVYDWDNMLDDYGYNGNVSYTDKQAQAVAQLASDCGISVQMQYTKSSSGAKIIRQPVALVNYFGYDEGMSMLYRNFFNQCEWDSIMFHELNEGRPMLIGGWSPTRAHSYLCDGYDSHGYFHLRLGNPLEDGNGYYYFTWTTPLQPEWYDINSAEGGFNLLQSILIGVKPKKDNTPSAQHYLYSFSHIDPLGGEPLTVDRGEPFDIGVYALCNVGWNDHPGTVGIALKKKDDGKSTPIESTRLLYTYSRHFPLEEFTDSMFDDTITLRIPASVQNGDYKIVPVYEENGQFIEARTMVGMPNNLRCEVRSNKITSYEPSNEHSSLRIVSVSFPDQIYRLDRPPYSYTITNDGSEYSGRVFCCLYKEDNPDVLYTFSQQGVSIDKDEVQTYNFKYSRFNTIPPGENYHLRIYADIDLLTDSVVVLYDDPTRNITAINGHIPTAISEVPSSTTSSYYDLRGQRISSPLSLPKHSVYIEIDESGKVRKRIR